MDEEVRERIKEAGSEIGSAGAAEEKAEMERKEGGR